MKRGIIIFSLALVLVLSAPVNAYSFQDFWDDFTGFFDNLITGAAGVCVYDCIDGVSCPSGYVGESGICPCDDPDNCEDTVCCREIVCGDDLIEGDEECDPPEDECTPGYADKCEYCNSNCDIKTVTGAFCGDGTCDIGKEDPNSCLSDCSVGGGQGGDDEDEPDLGSSEEEDSEIIENDCGDGICDKDEDCDSCPKDCDSCPKDCEKCETEIDSEVQLSPREATLQMLKKSRLDEKEIKFIEKIEDSLKPLLIFQQNGSKLLLSKLLTKKEDVVVTVEKTENNKEKSTKILFNKELKDNKVFKSPDKSLAELTVSRKENDLPKVLLKLFTIF